MLFSIIGLLFSLIMTLSFSATIWNTFPVLTYIQFPWRFLTFASLFSSLLAARAIEGVTRWLIPDTNSAVVNARIRQPTETWQFNKRFPRSAFDLARNDSDVKLVPDKISPLLFTAYCLLLTAYSLKFFQPQFKYPTTAGEQTSREKIVWEVSKRSDEYLPKGFERPENLEEALRGGNLYNQRVVDDIKKATPVRRLANAISLISFISLIIFIPYAISERVRTA
jgi:hypothetical protein